MTANEWVKTVLDEEKEIADVFHEKQTAIDKLRGEISAIKKSMDNGYQTRRYCKFSDGYICSFGGTCTHKEVGSMVMFGPRCLIVKHANEVRQKEGKACVTNLL
jgi:hypothetical protein